MPSTLVTAALPYANGEIHLGHLLEAIQTDVYVRARKLAGDDVGFMWAADTHGTPISLRARREGITPEELISKAHASHVEIYQAFGIAYDIYHTTHSPETQEHANVIFEALKAAGLVSWRLGKQLYCSHDQMFLPDRFVKGQCPKCGELDQYGDNCEKCGAAYEPTDLKDPKCSICSSRPELVDTEHLYVSLAGQETFLRQWLHSVELSPTVRNYMMRWVEGGLRDWAISRDTPYFGFPIPGTDGKKFFYVWFDAPIGYIGATQKWAADRSRSAQEFWGPSSTTEIVHVIGKDIAYFHCLFWPAMLQAAGYKTPSRIQVHGYLTVNGEKMSKTRGTFVLGRTYLAQGLPVEALRYYFAAKLGPDQDDLDLSVVDFTNRVNADLVKKAANLASRSIKFIHERLEGVLGDPASDAGVLLARAERRLREARCLYLEFESGKALRLAIDIADEFNSYVNANAPWKLLASDPERSREILSATIQACVVIAAILKPALPTWAEKVERMLGLAPLNFSNGFRVLPKGHKINAYETLAEPLQIAKLEAMIEASKA